ncbi:MAG: hypothetical protein P0Y62_08320 [Candidatus Chryseobacterium colombiense]|nr:hypothetical protein [Chryseobacterium sp.]WEK71557.1 MAG: hypothetical protein P0Y62_08320 [Chryseobacterium sp.]
MSSFYKSIGLYDSFSFDIDMNKTEFSESLKKITYETNTTFISLIPDHGIPTRFEYRGIVNKNDFTIKRRLHFFDSNVLHSVIMGSISGMNNKTSLEIKFKPFLFHFIIMIVSTVFAMFIAVYISKDENNYFILAIPFFVAIIQYFLLKRTINRDKYDFLRELNFITQKNNPFKNI